MSVPRPTAGRRVGRVAPAVRAIGWELWRKNRLGIVAALGFLAACAILYRFLFPSGPVGVGLLLSFYPCGITLFHAAYVFTFSENEPRLGLSGFPSRMFLLPARTAVLVGVPFVGGAIGISLLWAAWALLVFRPIGIELPLAWPSLLLAVGLAGFQLIGWTLGAFAGLRLAAYTLLVVALQAMGVVVSGWVPLEIPLPSIRALFFVAGALGWLGFFAASLGGVSRSRRGEWPPDFRAAPVATGALAARPLRPFASPTGAQLWYEWSQSGKLMPTYTGLLLLVLLLSAVDMRGENLWPFLLFVAGTPGFVAALVGPVHARASVWSRDLDLPHFLATRPLSDPALANAKLLNLGAGVLLSWVLALVVGPFAVLRTGEGERIATLWRQLEAFFGAGAFRGVAGVAVVALLGSSWIVAGAGLSVALTGRKELLSRAVFAGLGLVAALGGALWWLARNPEVLPELRSWVAPIEWGVALVAAGGAAELFRRAGRRRFLTPGSRRVAAILAVLLLGSTAALAGIAGGGVRSHLAAVGLATTALVLAPLAAAPLALSANRHR